FYGLGADATSRRALARLFAVKARDAAKPVGLIVSDLAMAAALVRELPPMARRLAEVFWPGPLTLVLDAGANIAPELIGPDGGLGMRVSSHPMATELVRRFGRPITATSANLAGAPPAETLAQARASFGDKVKVYLE